MEAAVVVVSWNRTMETVELEVFVKTMAVPLTVTIVAMKMALASINICLTIIVANHVDSISSCVKTN